MLSVKGLLCAALEGKLTFVPRFIAMRRFRQPLGTALLHRLGVLALLMIQWSALARHMLGKPSEWKGRSYSAATSAAPIKAT